MDDFDRAQEREQRDRDLAIQAQQDAAKHGALTPCCVCHNCDAVIGNGGLFCDCDCRDDYEYRLKIKQKVRG